MDITNVSFIQKAGVQYDDSGSLKLEFCPSVLNHVGTIHASAQFTLAETASGACLQSLFPELSEQVVPILREAKVKYSKPAKQSITAYSFVNTDEISTFQNQLFKKGRGIIEVSVEIKDSDEVVTCSGVFKWFVQNIS